MLPLLMTEGALLGDRHLPFSDFGVRSRAAQVEAARGRGEVTQDLSGEPTPPPPEPREEGGRGVVVSQRIQDA